MDDVATDPDDQQASPSLRDSKRFAVYQLGVHVVTGTSSAPTCESQADFSNEVGVALQHPGDILDDCDTRLQNTDSSDRFVNQQIPFIFSAGSPST